jgi:hypothetical protein
MRRVSSSSRAVPRSDIHAILTPEGHMDFAKYFQRDPRSLRGSFCTACQDSHGPWIPRSDHRRSFLNRNGGTCGISSRSSLFTMTFTPCPGDPSLRVPLRTRRSWIIYLKTTYVLDKQRHLARLKVFGKLLNPDFNDLHLTRFNNVLPHGLGSFRRVPPYA